MPIPYRARVNERWFLNLPGFHGGAYVVAYVEDTSQRDPERVTHRNGERVENIEPRTILEIADRANRIELESTSTPKHGARTRCTSSSR